MTPQPIPTHALRPRTPNGSFPFLDHAPVGTKPAPHITIAKVKKAVCDAADLDVSVIDGDQRRRDIALTRHVAIYLARQLTGASLQVIGSAFGLHHSTIVAACDKIAVMVSRNPDVAADLEALSEGLRAGTLPAAPSANRIQPPADLALRAAEMQIHQLAAHYKISEPTMLKLLRRQGLRALTRAEALARQPKPAPAHTPVVAPKVTRAEYLGIRKIAAAARPPVARVNSNADAAARELQRFGETIRCDADGKPDPKTGQYFRFCGRVKTPDEIVELAVRKAKFDPDAWKRIGSIAA